MGRQAPFTVDEANALLPVLSQVLIKLKDAKDEVVQTKLQLQKIKAKATWGGRDKFEPELFRSEAELEFLYLYMQDLIDRIADHGCQLKDIDLGLIDFPTTVDGEPALLCWRLGEPAVGYWHRVQDGYRGRQPVAGHRIGEATPEDGATGAGEPAGEPPGPGRPEGPRGPNSGGSGGAPGR